MVSWSTATDWDAATAESGVVHESVSSTDHNDASVLKQGYSAASPYKSADLLRYYPLNDSSGPVADFSSTPVDGTVSGASFDSTGISGTTSMTFAGGADRIDIGTVPQLSQFTLHVWGRVTGGPGDRRVALRLASNNEIGMRMDSNDDFRGWIYNGSSEDNVIHPTPTVGDWYLWTWRWDGSTAELFQNATSEGTTSASMSPGAAEDYIGNDTNEAAGWVGDLTQVVVSDTYWTDAEIQAFYDVVATAGTLTTAWKVA